jgi:hypothetical protein
MLEESFRVYASLLHAPIPFPRNAASTDAEDPDLPIEGCDRLSATEIAHTLEELFAAEVEEMKEYETKNKNRGVLVERFDRSLV